MKIIDNRREEKISVHSLNVGDFFELNNNVYVKLDNSGIVISTFNFSLNRVYNFEPETIVRRIKNVQLVITD
jgi:hypothetical protein